MEEVTKAITWEAPEHVHFEKSADWYWILGIISLSGAIAVFFLDNFLLSILILIAAGSMALLSTRHPRIIPFAVSTRGITIDNQFFPYNTLDSFHIEEGDPLGPQLLLKSKRLHMTLMSLPLPEDYVDDIEDILVLRLRHEMLEEPLLHKILEFFGF